MSPAANPPTALSGMMCSTKSTGFISLACLAKPATAAALPWPVNPAPGCSKLAMTAQ